METRKPHTTRSSSLPVDYMKMVNGVFTTNFDEGLKALTKASGHKAYFSTEGEIHTDEVVLCVSLMQEDQLAATSVYASIDFDSKASAPTIQDLLGACVDTVGSIFGQLLDPTKPEIIEQIADQSLSAMENIPFVWTEIQVEKYRVFVKIDKANPMLDRMTDDWLSKHDPDAQAREEEEHKETENLFFTGPKKKLDS